MEGKETKSNVWQIVIFTS